VKVRDAIRIVEADGWRKVSQVGSHRQFKHPVKTGRVTVAGKPGTDVPIGTLKSIFRQAQLQEKEG
jgi:predicted RNA binding protein YcfA (HicA-like mRNA interferase family)